MQIDTPSPRETAQRYTAVPSSDCPLKAARGPCYRRTWIRWLEEFARWSAAASTRRGLEVRRRIEFGAASVAEESNWDKRTSPA